MTGKGEIVNGEEKRTCNFCGSANTFANEYSYGQCRYCGKVLEPEYGRSIKEGSRRPLRKVWTANRWLEEASAFHGYSLRRFYDQVRGGRVLGMGYESGEAVIRCAPNEMVGPVADKPQEVMLPVGTRGISVDVCPGSPISGRPYVEHIDVARRHPLATVRCPPGCSGTYVRIFCEGVD